jgi:diaminohydroxyphosphoribosylaminopyrimidine deaminase / 5-amino-6-(5-phosphoribosylamino)uracil reductase
VRVVLDSVARLPTSSQLVQTARDVPTLVVTTSAAADEQIGALRDHGCEVLTITTGGGRHAVAALLGELGRRRMTNLLVEGGSEALGRFLDARLIDEVHVFVAPRLAGGSQARTPIAGEGVQRVADALPLSGWQVEQIEGDVYLHGWRDDLTSSQGGTQPGL